MKAFVISIVLSLGSQIWGASVPVDLSNQNRDPRVVWNVFVPDETHSGDISVGFKKAREVDMYDLLKSDKEDLEESDVYWRPWKGTVPKDAVMGAYGETNCGSNTPIYMAQVLHKASSDSGILPAQMFKKSKAATVSYGRKEYRYKENIKILCAEDPNILTWVPINETKNLNLTANKDCVIAGADMTFNTFFGRTNYEDETVIGKVLYHSNSMYFPYYGEEKYLTKDFEILCYKKTVETRRIEAIRRKLEEEKQKKLEEEKQRKLEEEKQKKLEEEKQKKLEEEKQKKLEEEKQKKEEAEAIRRKVEEEKQKKLEEEKPEKLEEEKQNKVEEEKQKKEEAEAIRRKMEEEKQKKEETTEVPITSTTTEAIEQDQEKGTDRIPDTNPSFHDGHNLIRFG